MEPITVASAFATVVGLLSVFKQERKDATAASTDEFLQWLDAHRHQEIRDQIAQSYHLSTELNQLLQADHGQIMEKLGEIDSVLATLARQTTCFRGLASMLRPDAGLSEQALHFLRTLVSSDAKEIGKMSFMGGFRLQLVPSGGEIRVMEPRLVDDDLGTLVQLGLLRYRAGSKGTSFYGITRSAVGLMELSDGSTAAEAGSE